MLKVKIPANIQGLDIWSTWTYDDSDPFAMFVAFHMGDGFEDIAWVFARDVLYCALQDRVSGEADVVWIVEDHLARLMVSSPEGKAEILFTREHVERFFAETLDIVPLGAETLDIDAALALIFEETI